MNATTTNRKKAAGGIRDRLFSAMGHPGLSTRAHHLLLVLILYADRDTGFVYTSLDTLVRQTRISKRIVAAALAELEKAGWLTLVAKGSFAGRKSTGYRVQFDRPIGAAGEPMKPSAIGATGEPKPTTPIGSLLGGPSVHFSRSIGAPAELELKRKRKENAHHGSADTTADSGTPPRSPLTGGATATAAEMTPEAQAARQDALATIAAMKKRASDGDSDTTPKREAGRSEPSIKPVVVEGFKHLGHIGWPQPGRKSAA